jgi:hypothetical protein
LSATVRVTAGPPVVVERPVYFAAAEGRTPGAHSATGLAGPLGADYYFAEGTTRPGYETYWTIANPHATPLAVFIRYLVAGGAVERAIVIDAASRMTVRASSETDPGAVGPGLDFGARIWSRDGRGFAVERPIYVSAPGRSDGHVGWGVSLADPGITSTVTATVTP